MCKPIAVLYTKLRQADRLIIAKKYKGEVRPRVKCVRQVDGSWWVMAPTGTNPCHIRSAINLRKKVSPKIYFTEFPFSALAMPRGVA